MKKKNKIEMVERWDLKAISMTDAAEVQTALEEGFEPFSVSSLMKKNENPLTVGMNANNGMTVETVIWMKRRHLVPAVSEGLASVTPLEPA